MKISKNLTFPSKIEVTDFEINLESLSSKQNDYFINIFHEMVRKYESLEKNRVVFGISGPPGSGKSVLVALLEYFAENANLDFNIQRVGIDAFHFNNDYLLNTKTDTGELLKVYKGRYDTYDIALMEKALLTFKNGGMVSLPKYSRDSHEPIQNAQKIQNKRTLLLIEGQWLLRKEDGWKNISDLIDVHYFLPVNESISQTEVVARHVRGGRSEEDALNQYIKNDANDYEIVMNYQNLADIILKHYSSI